MKKTLMILLLAAFGLAAQTPVKAAKKATTASATSHVPTIPKGAVANPNGTYSWTDKNGTKWLYARTPFGLMRTQTGDAPVASTPPDNVKAVDEGDKVRFETLTPFGVMRTEKKKSDLTDEERSLLDSQTTVPAAKQE